MTRTTCKPTLALDPRDTTPNAVYLLFIDGTLANTTFFSLAECDSYASRPHYAGRPAIAVRYARDLRTLTAIPTRPE